MTSSEPSNNPSTVSLIARCDKEIAKQKAVLRNLYAERNSLLFIARLPTEIIETVFIRCVRDEYYRHSNVHDAVPAWVHVSYVCHEWRAIALNCAELWTYHFVVTPDWTDELLVRSKNASLKIRLDNFDMSRVWGVVAKVLNHVERIEELSLDFPDNSPDWILSKLSSPAPRLRYLKISVDAGAEFEFSSVLTPFGGDTPALRTLKLQGCPVLSDSFQLSGLTTLDLSYPREPHRQSMDALLAALGCMQGLTYLLLNDALAGATEFLSSMAFNTRQKINLPRLSRLFISSPLSTIIAFLSSVTIPSETQVKLDVTHREAFSLNNFAVLSSLLAQWIHVSEQQDQSHLPARSLVMEFHTSGALRLKLSGTERNCKNCESPLFRLIYSWSCDCYPVPLDVFISPTELAYINRFWGDLVRSLARANIKSIFVWRPSYWSGFWGTILESLKDLSYIKMTRGHVTDLFRNVQAHAASDGKQHHMVLPALKVLELHDMSFLGDGSNRSSISLRRFLDSLPRHCDPHARLKMTACKIGKQPIADMDQLFRDANI